jgi:(2Fe-2S) ferredoxin
MPEKKVLVCLGRSCREYHSQGVFTRFKQELPTSIELIAVGCLGQCGNGPMVLIEPEQTWYSEISPDEVVVIIKQHLQENSPVKEMLYPKFHQQ